MKNPLPAGHAPGRVRALPGLRALVRETELTAARLVLPLFVTDDPAAAVPVDSLPGVRRHLVAELPAVAAQVEAAGLGAVLLFGVPQGRDPEGEGAWAPGNLVEKAIAGLKQTAPDLVVMTDVCLCPWRSDGHCGRFTAGRGLDHAATRTALARMAVRHAEAGADVVAPSAMADGQVAAIRAALDQAGFRDQAILAYSAKFASAFYGPFRDAARSAPAFGDRRSHQLDPANGREAVHEVALDLAEGADLVMVKPALPALDVIAGVRARHPAARLFAYQVSGELAQLQAAAQRGWLDYEATLLESLLAIRRAGADAILTYAALDAAAMLRSRRDA